MLDFKKLQTKRKELASKIEVYLMSKEGFRNKILSLNKYLKYILDSQSDRYYTSFVDTEIGKLDLPEDISKSVRVIVGNTLKYVLDNRYRQTDGPSKEFLLKVAIGVSVRVVNELNKIVGVQPITAPVGQIFFMRYKNDGKIVNSPKELDEFITNGTKLSLEVLSQAVEACTRQCAARWDDESFTGVTDYQKSEDLDFENEFTKAVAYEVSSEILNEVIGDLVTVTDKHELVDEFEINFNAPLMVKDQVDNLVFKILANSNKIASLTRRGAGNVMICSPTIVSMLQASKYLIPSDRTGGDLTHGFSGPILSHVGKIAFKGNAIGIDVYMYLHGIKVDSEGNTTERIIMGYRGRSSIDTGYVYAPYMPVISGGKVIHPTNGNYVHCLMTRAGKALPSPEHYRSIKITTKTK